MPALRNRQHLMNGSAHSNGYSKGLIEKKLALLQEEQSSSDGNNNCGALDEQSDEESFVDTCTMGAHSKIQQEEPMVFGPGSGSIGQTVKDQFAVALLRLQSDLDATSRRLSSMESKLDSMQQQQRQQSRFTQNKESAAKSRLFNRDNVASLVYLSWPIVVFLALRAIERRSLAAGRMA